MSQSHYPRKAAPLHFTKMHGAGNDFVVIDRRYALEPLDPGLVLRAADRHRGVGFDQLLTLERAATNGTAASYRVWNADGTEAKQCGNGARCLVAWLVRDGAAAIGERVRLDGPAGPIEAVVASDGTVSVNMGVPAFEPAMVPFDAPADAPAFPIEVAGARYEIGVVSMGNPHAVLVVQDVAVAPVATLGAALEQHARFPQRCNVGFAQIVSPRVINLRVFERGAGETLACGSGACAAVAVLRRRALVDERVAVRLPGGTLTIEWAGGNQPVWMSGPAAFVFEGEILNERPE